MYSGATSMDDLCLRLVIDMITMRQCVHAERNAILRAFPVAIKFHERAAELRFAIHVFKSSFVLPYCIGAFDVTNVRQLLGLEQKYFEARCFERYPSIILFAACLANRSSTFTNLGRPDMLSAGRSFDRSSLIQSTL